MDAVTVKLIVKVISWFALGFSLLGAYLINKKRIKGYYLWIVANALWILVNYLVWVPAQMILFTVYQGFNIHGIWSWRKLAKEDKKGALLKTAKWQLGVVRDRLMTGAIDLDTAMLEIDMAISAISEVEDGRR